MKYYIAENGQPAGPFELKELLKHGLTVNSQVWNETMDSWQTASEVPEVYNLLQGGVMGSPQVSQQETQQYAPPSTQTAPSSGQPFQQSYAPQQPAAQPQYTQPQYTQPQYGQQAYGAPQYGQPYQYAQPQYAQPHGRMPQDWKVANIIVTLLSLLCCCNPISLITGIVGWVKSSNVRTLYNHGDQLAAEEAAESAKKWFFITLILMIVLYYC